MQTYLFYDLETSGLNPAFDQVLQFAAIRTDLDLNEINRYEIHCQLRPDVVPNLEAVLTHRLSPLQAQSDHLPTERDSIYQIHTLLNEPGTISIGYNTLGFDDEFLRFSFFRNLLAPYTHQFKDQCQRMDLLPITVMYYLFKPEAVQWPQVDGQVSLKLEELNQLNNWVAGQAHDAMVDVEATVALAQQLQQYSDMWRFCVGYFDKREEQARFGRWALNQERALWVHNRLGAEQNYIAPVACLGQHWHYRNQTLFIRLDQQPLETVTANDWPANVWVFKKKWGEPGFLLPMKERYAQLMSAERQTLAQRNWQWLHDNPHYWQQLQSHHLDYKYPIVPEADTDSVLYQHGFLSNTDERVTAQIHQNAQDITLQKQLISELSTAELRELAWRLLARNHYQHLSGDDQQQAQQFFQQQLTQPIVDYRHQAKYNLTQAQLDLDNKSQAELDNEQKQLLVDYQQFLQNKTG